MSFMQSAINYIMIRHSCPVSKYGVNSSRNPGKYWIPPCQARGRLGQARNDKKGKTYSKEEGRAVDRGFTLIEIMIVIVILAIVSAISIKFVIDGLRIYTMTVNQKILYDEGKLAIERMCRDIRDAQSISAVTTGPPGSITFIRTNTTAYDAGLPAPETIIFRQNGSILEKVKGASDWEMADNVTAFIVTEATNEIQLQLILSLTSGENVTLQTKVYPKNLPKDTTYKNFYQNWMEEYQ